MIHFHVVNAHVIAVNYLFLSFLEHNEDSVQFEFGTRTSFNLQQPFRKFSRKTIRLRFNRSIKRQSIKSERFRIILFVISAEIRFEELTNSITVDGARFINVPRD